jgi:hypothetical protein
VSIEQEFLEEFGTITFSEGTPTYKSLGWAPADDERDYKAEDYFTAEITSGKALWANPIQLDQGREGACVGFGWTGFLNAKPVKHEYGNQMGFDVYHRAQQIDEWPGEAYSGTSVRAGAKVLVERGHINAYAFTQDVETLAHFLLNNGPAPIGVNWHQGMDRVDSEGYIYPTGSVRGGHCVIVDGVVFGVDDEVDRFRIRNSWGLSWGLNGRCRIKVEDLGKLFSAGGTACMAVDIPSQDSR